MFIPYSTNAPIYYWPYATLGIIVANVLVFIGMATRIIQDPDQWLLMYDQGLTPLQWLLSMFAHADEGHLLGNMLFLWVFGLVVEGKLGWYRFLLVYLSIGIIQSAGEQSLMVLFGAEGASLGASSAIYGIMVIAAIWAPKNDISVFYWFFFFFMGTFEIPVLTLAGLYVGYDLIMLLISFLKTSEGMLFEGLKSSSWLHIGGVLVGVPIGIGLLKKKIVDCEGWDIFHVYSGDYGAFVKKPELAEIEAEISQKKQLRDSALLTSAPQQIELYLQQGNLEAGYKLYSKMNSIGEGLQLSRKTLLQLISGLHRQKRWADSCPLMAELIDRYPEDSGPVAVKLAQICVVELNRPGKAIEILKLIDSPKLPENVLNTARKIARRAQQLQEEGVVELDTDRW